MPDDWIVVLVEAEELEPCLLFKAEVIFMRNRNHELESDDTDQCDSLIEHQDVPEG